MSLYYVVEKCQTSALASQRPLAYAGEMAVGVELVAVELSHHSDILHLSILHNGLEDNLSVGIHVLQLVPCDMLEESRYGEYGAGTEPTAHVVATDMIEHRVIWYLEDIVLQFFQRTDTSYLLASLRVTEDEVTESHVLFNEQSEVDVHRLRVLVNKQEIFFLRLQAVVRLCTLQNQRNILVTATYFTEQFQSCFRVTASTTGLSERLTVRQRLHHRIAGITDYSERIVMILLIERHCLFIVTRQHHFRSAALALCCGMRVERFLGESLTLLQDIVI